MLKTALLTFLAVCGAQDSENVGGFVDVYGCTSSFGHKREECLTDGHADSPFDWTVGVDSDGITGTVDIFSDQDELGNSVPGDTNSCVSEEEPFLNKTKKTIGDSDSGQLYVASVVSALCLIGGTWYVTDGCRNIGEWTSDLARERSSFVRKARQLRSETVTVSQQDHQNDGGPVSVDADVERAVSTPLPSARSQDGDSDSEEEEDNHGSGNHDPAPAATTSTAVVQRVHTDHQHQAQRQPVHTAHSQPAHTTHSQRVHTDYQPQPVQTTQQNQAQPQRVHTVQQRSTWTKVGYGVGAAGVLAGGAYLAAVRNPQQARATWTVLKKFAEQALKNGGCR